MSHDGSLKTVFLKVPGSAEPGDWKYSIQTTILQAFTITVTSQASRDDVPPITVKTHMDQKFSDGTKPMIVFAEVSQNYRPVINAEVWATLESETGSVHTLQLLDNGAGADAIKDDGIYSRYFTKMVNGRSSLKVRVKNPDGQARFAVLYVPGCVFNVQLIPPKLPVSENTFEVENFTRTDTGESFEVTLSGTTPPNFPPNRITDLSAEIQEDTVLLNWTAPGEDLDQGTVFCLLKLNPMRSGGALTSKYFDSTSAMVIQSTQLPSHLRRLDQLNNIHLISISQSKMASLSSLQFRRRTNKKQNLKPPTLLKLQRSSMLQNLWKYQTQT